MNEDKMWEWYIEETRNISKEIKIPNLIADDVISNVIFKLLQSGDKAKQMYGNRSYLKKLVYTETYGREKLVLKSRTQYFNYLRYKNICEKNDIPFDKSNAFKISALSTCPDDTIAKVYGILAMDGIEYKQVSYEENANSKYCIGRTL